MKALRDMSREEAIAILDNGKERRLKSIPPTEDLGAEPRDLWKYEHWRLTGSRESFQYSNNGSMLPAVRRGVFQERL